MTDASKIAAVILAAGAGTRFGGAAKAMLGGNRSFLARITGTMCDAGMTKLIAVVGPPFAKVVALHAAHLGASVVVNEHPERGMASSVATGFASLAADVDAAWLWPVDHPFVQPRTLTTLIESLGAHSAVRPTFEGRRGHPPLISRTLFAQLAACTNVEGGARTVLAAADTLDVEVDDPGVLRDIDTPADLEAQ